MAARNAPVAGERSENMNGQTDWQLALLYNRLNRTQETVDELEIFLKLVPDSSDKNKVQEMIARLKAAANNKK